MKTRLPQFLSAPNLLIAAAIALTIALLLASPFLLPGMSQIEVKASSTADANPVTSGDFEPQSLHYSAAANRKAQKPPAGKRRKPRTQTLAAATGSDDN